MLLPWLPLIMDYIFQDEINPFLPMLLLVMVFIIATESTVEQSIKMQSQLSMVALTYNPSILEVEATGVALSLRPLQDA